MEGNKIIPTQASLDLVRKISEKIHTFHHHYFILMDIANTFTNTVNYLEIGAFKGASSALMLHRPNTKVVAIDCGEHTSKEIIEDNLISMGLPINTFWYLEGNSHDTKMHHIADHTLLGGVDMMFIDGDHSINGVIADFFTYEYLLNRGGFIIFDDYNDKIYNPQVKEAVDWIVGNISGYKVIGTFKNNMNAEPINIPNGNCFVIKKI